MRRKILRTWLIFVIIMSFNLQSCVEIPSGERLPLDLAIDTGQHLKELMQATLADLHEAERIAGEEIRASIDKLQEFITYVDQVFGDRLERTIASLDASIQAKLRWIQSYTEQIHRAALDIIHATGEEARQVIDRATDDMRRAINTTEQAIQRTTFVISRNMIFLVDTVADRSLAIGGLLAGLLLSFICAYSWGRMFYQKNLPEPGLRRSLAMGFLGFTVLVAIAPFSLLFPIPRALALTPSGKSEAIDIPASKPSIFRFVPDPVVVSAQPPYSELLTIEGINLLQNGEPKITFGALSLDILGRYDDKISVDVKPVCENPNLARSIIVQLGEGPQRIVNAVPVLTATPGPTQPPKVPVPDVVGMGFEDARRTLAAARLQIAQLVDESGRLVLEREAETVLETFPPAGEQVTPNSDVKVVVSVAVMTHVPNLVGETMSSARALLGGAGLQVGDIKDQAGNPVEEGRAKQVLASSPAAGASVKLNTKVNLAVTVYTYALVPDISGKTYTEASDALRSVGLTVGDITDSSGTLVGVNSVDKVIKSQPPAGTEVRENSRINLIVTVIPIPPTLTVPTCPPGESYRPCHQCWPVGNPCP